MASALARACELPQFKGRPGWEFTDISGLDLAAYEPVSGAGRLDGARPARAAVRARHGAPATLPDGVIVTSIEQAAREHGELLRRHLGVGRHGRRRVRDR